MADKVTVDKVYFEALLRRADFHTTPQLLGSRADTNHVAISRVEYDHLLRTAREYELLRNALFAGGLTPEALSTLINNEAGSTEPGQDHIDSWDDDFNEYPPSYAQPLPSYAQPMPSYANGQSARTEMPWKSGAAPPYTSNGGYGNGHYPSSDRQAGHRQMSYGMMPPSTVEDGFDESDSLAGGDQTEVPTQIGNGTNRTLYFCNFPPQTTYRDLLTVIKGGKVLSVNLRSERSATVTFLDGAAEFLHWAKRNDIYIHHKRVDVRWADRQFQLNGHVGNKVSTGATRNILIRSALDKGFTEERIRDDMEHIHNLVIIDVKFRAGNAYVSTNSVHNALFARTCMLSRTTYKGCKIEFYPDECDVPLPTRNKAPPAVTKGPMKKDVPLTNRFDLLDMGDENADSGAENRDPMDDHTEDSDYDDDDDTINIKARHGVRLDFLDSESTV